MNQVRVLLVDDSALARALLRDLLEGAPGIEVVGEAANGRDGVRLASELRPDVVTMDLEMPVMGGMEAIEEIMATKAVPILVVSNRSDAQTACAALAKGALEVLAKPELDEASAEELVAKVRMLAGVRVIRHLRGHRLLNGNPQSNSTGSVGSSAPAAPASPSVRASPILAPAPSPAQATGEEFRRLFAIASSTGGPQALAALFAHLPAGFPCPILVAQHIADGFAGGMAEWLNDLSPLRVRLAAEGELLLPGTIYIAPSERHLAVNPTRRLTLLERAPIDIYRPSCDRLLGSVAEVYRRHAVGIILTGMGSDGAAGMEHIHRIGGITLAQDEGSSLIYGMNRVAIERGAVQRVLPLAGLAGEMARLAGVRN